MKYVKNAVITGSCDLSRSKIARKLIRSNGERYAKIFEKNTQDAKEKIIKHYLAGQMEFIIILLKPENALANMVYVLELLETGIPAVIVTERGGRKYSVGRDGLSGALNVPVFSAEYGTDSVCALIDEYVESYNGHIKQSDRSVQCSFCDYIKECRFSVSLDNKPFHVDYGVLEPFIKDISLFTYGSRVQALRVISGGGAGADDDSAGFVDRLLDSFFSLYGVEARDYAYERRLLLAGKLCRNYIRKTETANRFFGAFMPQSVRKWAFKR